MSSICVYFMRGTCRFGNRCWNSHDLGSARSVSPYHETTEETTADEESFTRRDTTQNHAASSKRETRNQVPDPAQKSQKNPSESKLTYTLTNNISGEAREGIPDSMLVETVKKLNESENMVQTLLQKLHSKDNGENFSCIEHQIKQYINNDLQCIICYEIFIKPTVLNCSHTFCHECIQSWTRRVNCCPICRVSVRNKSPCLTLDKFLDKITECLPDEVKSRRESLKIERNNRDTAGRIRSNEFRRPTHRITMLRNSGFLREERDRYAAEWNNIALYDNSSEPIIFDDIFGRNRDEWEEDWDDELSDSSTDSNYELEISFCAFCADWGHSTFNCPSSLTEETDSSTE